MSEVVRDMWAAEETARRRIRSVTGREHLRRIADRVIPRRVAPLQSPLPLHPAFAR